MWLDHGDLGGLLDYTFYSWRIVVRFRMKLNWSSYFGPPVPGSFQCHDTRPEGVVTFKFFLWQNKGLNFWVNTQIIRPEDATEIWSALHYIGLKWNHVWSHVTSFWKESGADECLCSDGISPAILWRLWPSPAVLTVDPFWFGFRGGFFGDSVLVLFLLSFSFTLNVSTFR